MDLYHRYAQKYPLDNPVEQSQIIDFALSTILYDIEEAFEGKISVS